MAETNLSQIAGTFDLGSSLRASLRCTSPPAGSIEEADALARIDAAREDELAALRADPHASRRRERLWEPRERHLRGW